MWGLGYGSTEVVPEPSLQQEDTVAAAAAAAGATGDEQEADAKATKEVTPLLVTEETIPEPESSAKESCTPRTKWWIALAVIFLLLIALVLVIIFAFVFGAWSNGYSYTSPYNSDIMYRPICQTFSGRKVRIIQTSLGEPDRHYAPVACEAEPPSYWRWVSGNSVDTFGAPDARLVTNLDEEAHPDRPPIMGFGGAFTEASALNYESLSQIGKDAVMELLFGETGLGYTLGRVHINSCDFCIASYNFDGVDGNFDLSDFDVGVQNDEETGMLPMMRRATSVSRQAWGSIPGDGDLKIIGSPWSPPAWMKRPGPDAPPNATHAVNMLGSAAPNCIRNGTGPESMYARTWAHYFEKWLTSYADAGVPLYAVTIQNEPMFDAPWESCLYTAPIMGTFLEYHLGPVLSKTYPDLKIFIYDHNKNYVDIWASYLLNSSSSKYIAGTAMHWYSNSWNRLLDGAQGAPNVHRLMSIVKSFGVEKTHLVWGTEACHCPSTGYAGGSLQISWNRAERYAHDILGDMAAGANAWIEWNLILDAIGGPNHLKNVCDAGLLAVPQRAKGAEGIPSREWFEDLKHPYGRTVGNERTIEELNALGMPASLIEKGVVAQAMHYYVGHISRHVRPGSRAVMALIDASEGPGYIFWPPGQTVPGGGFNNLAMDGIEVNVWPCEGSTRQQFKLNEQMQLQVFGETWNGLPTTSCILNAPDPRFHGVLLGKCNETDGAAAYEIVPFPGTTAYTEVNIILSNSNQPRDESCLIIKELKNNGGALGPRGGAQIDYGDCSSAKAVWNLSLETGIISSMYFGKEVCLTTGWPFLQLGAFKTPNGSAERVAIVLNEGKDSANYVLEDDGRVILAGSIPPNSIQTIMVD